LLKNHVILTEGADGAECHGKERTRMGKGRLLLVLAVSLILLLLSVTGALTARDSERIPSFRSHIEVHQDGRISVTETITVICRGEQIKRGIFRDFPTTYRDRWGNTVRVGFQPLGVERDGSPESFHLEAIDNGQRLYIGRKDVFLKPGTYTYTITYESSGQLGFFKDFDELYWNATGNGWSFVIERAEAEVELPAGAEVLRTAAYTGRIGEKGQDFTAGLNEKGRVAFSTTRPLMPGEGLTIAVAWPKGVVSEPSGLERGLSIWRQNRVVAYAAIGLLALTGYYLVVWFLVGKDPAKGTIIPLFSPPRWLSPGAVRCLMRMGSFDHKALAATVVGMAVKGYLTISESDSHSFTLIRTGTDGVGLSAGELKVAKELFGSTDKVKLASTNHKSIRKAQNELWKQLLRDLRNKYFVLNSGYFAGGVVVAFLTLAAVIANARDLGTALFMGLWLSIWTAGCFGLAGKAFRAWKGVLSGGGAGQAVGAVGSSVFALPFLAGEVFGLWAFASAVSPFAAVILVLIVSINVLFYHLLKAPTFAGRKLMDEIEGFRLYLSVAEQERLNLLNPPEKTPELFEKYLPFALALDVENQWSEQFATVFASTQRDGSYQPGWYTGRSWSSVGSTRFATSLGSAFASALSSAATAPGSSSGSGGGGSSGGGGGGGGGGGW
jgi:hypothetical protein